MFSSPSNLDPNSCLNQGRQSFSSQCLRWNKTCIIGRGMFRAVDSLCMSEEDIKVHFQLLSEQKFPNNRQNHLKEPCIILKILCDFIAGRIQQVVCVRTMNSRSCPALPNLGPSIWDLPPQILPCSFRGSERRTAKSSVEALEDQALLDSLRTWLTKKAKLVKSY